MFTCAGLHLWCAGRDSRRVRTRRPVTSVCEISGRIRREDRSSTTPSRALLDLGRQLPKQALNCTRKPQPNASPGLGGICHHWRWGRTLQEHVTHGTGFHRAANLRSGEGRKVGLNFRSFRRRLHKDRTCAFKRSCLMSEKATNTSTTTNQIAYMDIARWAESSDLFAFRVIKSHFQRHPR
jgi:hypothetical protein